MAFLHYTVTYLEARELECFYSRRFSVEDTGTF
jgi:hypothetical protein